MGIILMILFALGVTGSAVSERNSGSRETRDATEVNSVAGALGAQPGHEAVQWVRGGYLLINGNATEATVEAPVRGSVPAGVLRVCAPVAAMASQPGGVFARGGWRLTSIGQASVNAPLSEEAAAKLCWDESNKLERAVLRFRHAG